MFDWWLDQPWYLRATVAVLLMAIGALLFFVPVTTRGGIILGVLGFILLMFTFPVDSEKNGYHF